MMNNTDIAAKSLLAKLLATENIRVEHNSALKTASFDLKNRVLNCPVWEAMDGDMYDMLLGHEISHARNTPLEGWHTAIVGQGKKQQSYKHFLNIVEDARIEKLIKRQYPGLRRPFIKAYNALHERDLFKVKGTNTSTLFFIDRVNLHCKMGFAMNIRFNTEERALLALVENAETWHDVEVATEKIWEYSKKEQQEDKDKKKKMLDDMSESLTGDEDEEEGDEDGNQDEGDEDEEEGGAYGDEDEDSDEDSDEDGDEDGEDGDEDEDSDEDSDEDGKRDRTGTGGNSTDEFIPRAGTEEEFRKNEHLLNAKDAPMLRYIDLPAVNLDNVVAPQKVVNAKLSAVLNNVGRGRKLLLRFQEKNQAYINTMVKEFEMKKAAKKFIRAKVAESGDINMSKLGLYRTEDNIFKKITTLQQGKSHGLVLLLDKSGSMRNLMPGAIEQILILASFCRKVNIPFVAYGFANRNGEDRYRSVTHSFTKTANTLRLGALGLREIINSNMQGQAFTQAMINQLSLAEAYATYSGYAPYAPANGGIEDKKYDHDILVQLPDESLNNTPLDEALTAMFPIIKEFKTARRLDLVNLVIVHDGDADHTNQFTNESLGYDRFNSDTERVYLRNPVDNTQVMLMASDGYRATTCGLMNLLRKSCGIGIYGFFIGTSGSDIARYYVPEKGVSQSADQLFNREQRMLRQLESKVLAKKLRAEKFLESWTSGYDRFYLLPEGDSMIVQDAPIMIKGSVTPRKLAQAFIKQGKAKYSNRVLVSRFIEKIAR